MDEKDKFGGWTEAEWRVMVQQIIAKSMQDRDSAANYVSSMSGWLIAQLFVGNAGGITLLYPTGEKEIIGWFLAGLILSVLCGLAAWFHALKEFENSDHFADARAMLGSRHFPKPDDTIERPRELGFKAALWTGAASGVCFVIGALISLISL